MANEIYVCSVIGMIGSVAKHAPISTASCAAGSPFVSTVEEHASPDDAAISQLFCTGVIDGRLAALATSFAATARIEATATQPMRRTVIAVDVTDANRNRPSFVRLTNAVRTGDI